MTPAFKRLLDLALLARPQRVFPDAPHERDGGDDWGSQRQVNAENAFFEAVAEVLSADEYDHLEEWCHKASTDDMINEALRRCRQKMGV